MAISLESMLSCFPFITWMSVSSLVTLSCRTFISSFFILDTWRQKETSGVVPPYKMVIEAPKLTPQLTPVPSLGQALRSHLNCVCKAAFLQTANSAQPQNKGLFGSETGCWGASAGQHPHKPPETQRARTRVCVTALKLALCGCGEHTRTKCRKPRLPACCKSPAACAELWSTAAMSTVCWAGEAAQGRRAAALAAAHSASSSSPPQALKGKSLSSRLDVSDTILRSNDTLARSRSPWRRLLQVNTSHLHPSSSHTFRTSSCPPNVSTRHEHAWRN